MNSLENVYLIFLMAALWCNATASSDILYTSMHSLVIMNALSNPQVTADSTNDILTGQVWSPMLDTWDHSI